MRIQGQPGLRSAVHATRAAEQELVLEGDVENASLRHRTPVFPFSVWLVSSRLQNARAIPKGHLKEKTPKFCIVSLWLVEAVWKTHLLSGVPSSSSLRSCEWNWGWGTRKSHIFLAGCPSPPPWGHVSGTYTEVGVPEKATVLSEPPWVGFGKVRN